jgi:hypothetical protein
VNLHLSPYSGRIRQPWSDEMVNGAIEKLLIIISFYRIFIPGLPDRLPICYNGSSEHLENIVRISQVLCRHSGYMIATKYVKNLSLFSHKFFL